MEWTDGQTDKQRQTHDACMHVCATNPCTHPSPTQYSHHTLAGHPAHSLGILHPGICPQSGHPASGHLPTVRASCIRASHGQTGIRKLSRHCGAAPSVWGGVGWGGVGLGWMGWGGVGVSVAVWGGLWWVGPGWGGGCGGWVGGWLGGWIRGWVSDG